MLRETLIALSSLMPQFLERFLNVNLLAVGFRPPATTISAATIVTWSSFSSVRRSHVEAPARDAAPSNAIKTVSRM